jgi:DNA-binding transcriptional MerR regulator
MKMWYDQNENREQFSGMKDQLQRRFGMLRIGEFSILSSISIHMLRHYDKIGLLAPEHTDKSTGYRYYNEKLLLKANRILALKSMGFGLKEITRFLNENPDEGKFKQFLEQKEKEKIDEIKSLESQLRRIRTTILDVGFKNEFTGSIAVKVIPKRQVVSYRSKLREYSEEGLLWEALNDECQKLKIVFSSAECNAAVLHGVDPEKGEIDVEVQQTIEQYFYSGNMLEFKTIEAVSVASLIFQGGYGKLKDVNEYIAEWIKENNCELSGNLFNIYHISPESTEQANSFITEVCFPIRPRTV